MVKAYRVEARPHPDSGPTAETDVKLNPEGRLLKSWGKSWPAVGACRESCAAASASGDSWSELVRELDSPCVTVIPCVSKKVSKRWKLVS